MKPRNEGLVIDLDASEPLVYRDVALGASDGIAGAVDVRVVMGGPVTVTVLAIPSSADPASYFGAARLPGDGHNRHGTFRLEGFANTVVAYTAGGPDASLTYGDREPTLPNVDPNDQGRDVGDYGALRQIAFDLDNPSDAAATIYMYERPLGGVVRSSFFVDGKLYEAGCARLPNRYQIAAFTVGPRAQSELHVATMTDGGSAYPIEVGVTTTPPLATTPPLDALEGCFPKNGATPPP